jgi:hypothetical protein
MTEPKVRKAYKEIVVQQVHKVHKDVWVFRVQLAHKVQRALMEI